MQINFNKNPDKLIPSIIQDATTKTVLMLGYMNQAAYDETIKTKKVTFFSRSKNRLWTKGEESGNFLNLIDIKIDCDTDTLLVKVVPDGPSCHTGTDNCWQENNEQDYCFITVLEKTIQDRQLNSTTDNSYVASLFEKGINKIAQKVGEEAVEVIIEAKDNDKDLFLSECADLMFHYLILLQAKDCNFNDVVNILEKRADKK